MTTLQTPIHEIPRPSDLGPDPEPFASRFDVLMALEQQAWRPPSRIPARRRREIPVAERRAA